MGRFNFKIRCSTADDEQPAKIYRMTLFLSSMQDPQQRMRDGENFIELVWEQLRDRIIEMAVQVYDLSSEQAIALRKTFRKRYQIVAV